MKNDGTKTIFYLDLKHVHKYGCAKFQPNPFVFFTTNGHRRCGGKKATTQWKKKNKKKKKVCNPLRGSRQRTGCPNNGCHMYVVNDGCKVWEMSLETLPKNRIDHFLQLNFVMCTFQQVPSKVKLFFHTNAAWQCLYYLTIDIFIHIVLLHVQKLSFFIFDYMKHEQIPTSTFLNNTCSFCGSC